MIRKTKKTRKYHAPCAKETHVAFENNICSVVFNVQAQELDNINTHKRMVDGVEETVEPMYFEF